MKKLNINGKRSGFFTRGMAALCLSIVFESKSCFGSNLRAYQLASMPYQNFVASVEQCPDVSDWKDERGRYVFYIAVKYGYANKVQAILENFIQKKEAGFKHTNEDFINAFDRRTGATALWEAIRSGQNEVIEIFTKKNTVNTLTLIKFNVLMLRK
ncbi:hypothetical protein [Cardinium endosymbiont of Nabis limbatus]|uniref:hypothetical protein n=1 Tax=Cardinium endosymbiont of Nabis limbatus TaxID=3066217 RepID=UPI003AF39F23